MNFKNAVNHFKTITNHKILVMRTCFKVGLYKQGLLHDLSKYSFVEFSAGIKYYKGYISPNNIQKKTEGLSTAWLHHKGRNKHHFEYWIDYGTNISDGLQGMKIPERYIYEMFIDNMSACKNYQKDKYTQRSALEYYEKRKDNYIMNEESRNLLEKLLNMLADEGEESTISYIKDACYKLK